MCQALSLKLSDTKNRDSHWQTVTKHYSIHLRQCHTPAQELRKKWEKLFWLTWAEREASGKVAWSHWHWGPASLFLVVGFLAHCLHLPPPQSVLDSLLSLTPSIGPSTQQALNKHLLFDWMILSDSTALGVGIPVFSIYTEEPQGSKRWSSWLKVTQPARSRGELEPRCAESKVLPLTPSFGRQSYCLSERKSCRAEGPRKREETCNLSKSFLPPPDLRRSGSCETGSHVNLPCHSSPLASASRPFLAPDGFSYSIVFLPPPLPLPHFVQSPGAAKDAIR